jgi:hypothetical protein
MFGFTITLFACLMPVTEDSGIVDGGERVCGNPGVSTGMFDKQLVGCVRFRGSLELSGSMLTNLDIAALQSLRTIEGTLGLEFEDKIQSLSGLDKLETLGKLRLSSCSALTQLDGFGGLKELGGLAVMRGNTRLTSLRGFAPLASFSGSLFIADSSISTLEGLEQVTSLDSLYLSNNPIRSLAGLSALRTIRGDLTIESRVLPRSEIDAFLSRVQVGGTTTIMP